MCQAVLHNSLNSSRMELIVYKYFSVKKYYCEIDETPLWMLMDNEVVKISFLIRPTDGPFIDWLII